jgi:hypothetical protein
MSPWFQAYFLVAYDRQAGKVVGFFDSKSDALPSLYLQHTPYFHAACISSPWTRFLTPFTASLNPGDGSDSSQQWSQNQVGWVSTL